MFGFGFHLFRQTILSGGAGAAWTPAQLFGGGESGGWYDPSDISTLWKDTAGTDPVTADGDAVARIDDKSGNGNHLTQGTAANRPAYKTSGGLHWLLFDGADAIGRSDANYTDLSQPGTIGVGHLINDTKNVLMFVDGNDGGRWTVFQEGTSSREFKFFAGTVQTTGVPRVLDESNVSVCEFNGASSFYRLDGTEYTPGNPGSNSMGGIALGAQNTGGSNGLPGRVYAAVVTDDQLTAGEISELETWLANKSGVTL